MPCIAAVAALLFAAMGAATASAAESKPPVCPPSQASARSIAPKSPLSEADRLGLGYAIILGLSPDGGHPDWPKYVTKIASTCKMTSFPVGKETWTVQASGDGAAPPRWAASPSGAAIAFLATAPSLPEAYAYSQSSPTGSSMNVNTPIYPLTVVREKTRYVVAVYDAIPPSDQLAGAMAAGVAGELPLIAGFDPDSGAVSFAGATVSGRRAIIPGKLPGEGGPAVRLTAPDGDFFVQSSDGALKMGGSGFLCRAKAGDFPIRDLLISNATDESRDLGCRFFGDKSWISVFVTRYSARPTAQSVFDSYRKEVEGFQKLSGRATPVLAAGDSPAPTFAAAWRRPDGNREAMWLAQRGSWYVEVRATYADADSAAIGKAVADLYRQVFGEIAGS